jgi:hypothetical protein
VRDLVERRTDGSEIFVSLKISHCFCLTLECSLRRREEEEDRVRGREGGRKGGREREREEGPSYLSVSGVGRRQIERLDLEQFEISDETFVESFSMLPPPFFQPWLVVFEVISSVSHLDGN